MLVWKEHDDICSESNLHTRYCSFFKIAPEPINTYFLVLRSSELVLVIRTRIYFR